MTDRETEFVYQAKAAYEAGKRRDFCLTNTFRTRSSDNDSAVAMAWNLALSAQEWSLGGILWTPPAPSDLSALISKDPAARMATIVACVHFARAAALGFDTALLSAWLEVHGHLVAGLDDPAGHLGLRVMRAWESWQRGRLKGLDGSMVEVRAAAAKARLPELVVEATALRALVALAYDDSREATTLARRASLMSRTEALPETEVLANIVLARVRRCTGLAHLSTRILSALTRYAPPIWHGWLCWERTMAGDVGALGVLSAAVDHPNHPLNRSRVAHSLTALGSLLNALERGDESALSSSTLALKQSTAGMLPFELETNTLLTVLGVEHRSGENTGEGRAWTEGRVDVVPRGLAGLVFAHATSASIDTTVAHVVTSHGQPPRRIPHIVVPLMMTRTGANVLEQTSRSQKRVETGIAVLSLAGQASLSVAEYFSAVYQFDYEQALHWDTLGVHLHRLRARLGSDAELERDGDRLELRCHHPLVVPDPRCSQSLAEKVLHLLAAQRGVTAKEIAVKLRIPLRSIQKILRELLDENACVAEGQGRRVEYHVEDTTFSEPTTSVSIQLDFGD